MKVLNLRLAFALIATTLIVGILSSLGSIPSSKSAPASIASLTTLVINVKDYGALGNGIADDRLAIQTAINSVPSTGGTVYFPSGTYRIGSSTVSSVWNLWVGLTVGSSVNLLGEGVGKSIIKADSSLSMNRFVINAKPGDWKISINHLTLDMNQSPSSDSGSGLTFDRASDIKIRDTEVKNVNSEAFALTSVSNFYIEDSRGSNAWTGIYLTNCRDGQITGNSIVGTKGDGILLRSTAAGNCNNVSIDSNNIKNPADTGIDLSMDGSGTPHESIIVSGNIIQLTSLTEKIAGIRASLSRDVVIDNNIITNAGVGIIADTPPAPPRSMTISNNAIDGFVTYGIMGLYDGVVIDGNTINGMATSNGKRVGVGLGTDNLQVTSNFIGTTDYGIKWIAPSTKGIIDGNVIKNPDKYGIADDPVKNYNIHSFSIVNNIIQDWRSPTLMEKGINFEGTGTGPMTIVSNKIGGYTKSAITLTNKAHQISFNQFNGQMPSGTFTINSGTANGATIKIANPHVTQSSLILFSFEGDANTVDRLSVFSKRAGSEFTVKVYTNAKTTAGVTVDYMIFN